MQLYQKNSGAHRRLYQRRSTVAISGLNRKCSGDSKILALHLSKTDNFEITGLNRLKPEIFNVSQKV